MKTSQRAQKQKFWNDHVTAQSQSSVSQAQYCREHNLSLASFSYWRHKHLKDGKRRAAFQRVQVKADFRSDDRRWIRINVNGLVIECDSFPPADWVHALSSGRSSS